MQPSRIILPLLLLFLCMTGCEQQKEHTAPAVLDRDSADVMTSYGVNTLVSDSGIIKYRIVAERWTVNQVRHPSRWTFIKGIFMEAFDENFHVYSYVQADTAYYYDQDRIWNLRGRVRILSKDGLRFSSEEIFWDMNTHEIYSYVFSRLVTPERTLEGTYFKSDEQMTKYVVSNSRGSFQKADFSSPADSMRSKPDTVKATVRPQTAPRPKGGPAVP